MTRTFATPFSPTSTYTLSSPSLFLFPPRRHDAVPHWIATHRLTKFEMSNISYLNTTSDSQGDVDLNSLLVCFYSSESYGLSQVFNHNLLPLQSDLFGKPNHISEISNFWTLVTGYRACRQLGPTRNALPPSLLVAFIFQMITPHSLSFLPSRYILFSFPSWSSSGQTSSIRCLGLWNFSIGCSRPWCCHRFGTIDVTGREFSRVWSWLCRRDGKLVELPPYAMVFYPFSWWNKWVYFIISWRPPY